MKDVKDLIFELEQFKKSGGDFNAITAAVNNMAATGKTPLGLNQWEAEHKPRREQFNEDNKIIDEEIRRLSENKAEKSDIDIAVGRLSETKVDKQAGKSLSTNDYTNADKSAVGTIGSKAPIANPAFTGTPIAPTPSNSTVSTQIATTAFVQSKTGHSNIPVTTNILNLLPGTRYCAEGKLLTAQNYPKNDDYVHVTIDVFGYGSATGNGYKVIVLYYHFGQIYTRTQAWDNWTAWKQIV